MTKLQSIQSLFKHVSVEVRGAFDTLKMSIFNENNYIKLQWLSFHNTLPHFFSKFTPFENRSSLN